jgi:predicted dehydrogenase
MSNDKPVTLGIVGCGRVTETRHLPALKQLPQARVVAVTDIDPQRLQRVADHFQIPRRYPSFEELLTDQELEAIAVCVPTRLHLPYALAVLESGKHLFVEKPLALHPSDSEQILRKGKEARGVAMVGFNLRWHRLVRQARLLLQSGELGDLKMIRTAFMSATRNHPDAPTWRTKRELGGGVIIEQAIHHFDLWRFLLDDEVEEVFASSVNEDESAAVTARMSSGLLISSSFSEGTTNENEFWFYGKQACLRLSCYHFDGFEIISASDHPGDVKVRLKRIAAILKESPVGVSQFFQGSDFVASYKNEWTHFIDCIRRKQSPNASLEDGHRSIQILSAVLESAARHVPVRVNQDQPELRIAGDA